MTTDFKEAKVGDLVWDVVYGWGKIKRRRMSHIDVVFPCDIITTYTLQGIPDFIDPPITNRALYWDEVKITPPPKPMKKVKLVGWANLTYHHDILVFGNKTLYETKEQAIENRGIGTYLGDPVYINHEYEVEE